MKNKVIIIFAAAVFLMASCSSKDMQPDFAEQTALNMTNIITAEQQNTATPAASPTPTAEPAKPKYIFIVIGDGLGRGAMTLEEIYARIENEDMDKGAVWEDFTYQSYVTAMGESASGGTAIASGIETDPWHIGTDIDGQELYTIMDRAKEAGMSTGVITNSSLTDATPGTFLSHTTNRYAYEKIARGFIQSNVDYIAGGGLSTVLSENSKDFFNGEDSTYLVSKLEGPEETIPMLVEMGYETYLGLAGAQRMREAIENGMYTSQKAINIFTGGIMPYEYYKYNSPGSTNYDEVPTLVEMTEAGIQSLSQNENGFVMMIEAALIDKSAHKQSQEMAIYQVNVLNNVLEHLIDFYNEHPYETLIILTADHETGNYTHNDELLDSWEANDDFVWTNNGEEMAALLKQEWDIDAYSENLQTQINIALAQPWKTDEENKARLYNAVTMYVSLKYGTKITTAEHSGQSVPLFAIGKGSEEFYGSTHIKEVPITICEIMGWESLPEVIVPES